MPGQKPKKNDMYRKARLMVTLSVLTFNCTLLYERSSVSGGLAQLVATLVGSTKLLYAGPG